MPDPRGEREDRGREAAEAPGIPPEPVMTAGEEAEFRGRFASGAHGYAGYLGTGPRERLSPGEIRSLLRECVTVVRPGESLVIRLANLTPAHQREYQQWLNVMHDEGIMPFRAFVFPGDELGVMEAPAPQDPAPPPAEERDHAAWLADVREDESGLRLTHLPTGFSAEGDTYEGALAKLAEVLTARGTISVNDARAALGLPPQEFTTMPLAGKGPDDGTFDGGPGL
jgi:hypothetical protein